MKEKDFIEELFKDKLGNFEADVPSSVWSNVKSQLPSSPAGGSASGSNLLSGSAWKGVALLAGTAAVVGTGVWYFSAHEETVPALAEERADHTVELSEKEHASYNDPVGPSQHTSNARSSQAAYSSGQSADHKLDFQEAQSLQTKMESENTAGSETVDQPENESRPSRYGNSPKGPSRIIRGNNVQGNKDASNPAASNTAAGEMEMAKALILADKESGDWPLTVTFSNQGLASEVEWDFGDGNRSTELIPTHTFKKPGEYQVRLTARNSRNASSDAITIEVKPVSAILTIPNVFTPNGDGENDLFEFGLKDIISMSVMISSLNGELVHKWDGIEGHWDGSFMNAGKNVPDGLYFFTLRAEGRDGEIHTKKGSIKLLRSQ